MDSEANIDLDANEFYEKAREDVASLIGGAGIKAAVVFNASDKDVTFFVYNHIDTVYWVSAQKTLVARGSHGTLAASGAYFKVHPNDKHEQEFLVAPNKAYIYRGPGKIEEVE